MLSVLMQERLPSFTARNTYHFKLFQGNAPSETMKMNNLIINCYTCLRCFYNVVMSVCLFVHVSLSSRVTYHKLQDFIHFTFSRMIMGILAGFNGITVLFLIKISIQHYVFKIPEVQRLPTPKEYSSRHLYQVAMI